MNDLQTLTSPQDPEPEKQHQAFHNTTIANNNNIVDDDFGMSDYDVDSNCSTPYVSAPSSPGRGPSVAGAGGGGGGGYYYSAPASPMHFLLSGSYSPLPATSSSSSSSVHHEEFEFSARFGPTGSSQTGSGMSSADELFLNGQIRPMKLSTHLERPQVLAPLLDLENEEQQTEDGDENDKDAVVEKKFSIRGRDLRLRDKSLRRRTRSMSPMRSLDPPFGWNYGDEDEEEEEGKKGIPLVGVEEEEIQEQGVCKDLILECSKMETLGGANSAATSTATSSASSSRSSSAGRSSKRWVFLKDFLRSKSEGRSNNKFWSSITFSPSPKDKREKPGCPRSSGISYNAGGNNTNGDNAGSATASSAGSSDGKKAVGSGGQPVKKQGKPVNGAGKRRVPPSPHELHYTANRAQAEEMRKKTFLPYKQGLLGCLGFSSKGYGAVNGFARALNPVSSR